MQIDMVGPRALLEEIRHRLEDQLEKSGFSKGAKFDSMDSGVMLNYIRKEDIVSIHVSREAEGRECTLHMESEVEIPDLNDIWDAALASYGSEILKILRQYAIDKKKLKTLK